VKALILGGSGFVGRRLAEILAADDVDTTVLNRGVTPVSAPPGVKRITADRAKARERDTHMSNDVDVQVMR
jgi:nucleoside-diphosphate-sugar epimerase